MTNIIIHGIQIHDCKPVGNTNVRDSLGHFRYRGVFFFFFFFWVDKKLGYIFIRPKQKNKFVTSLSTWSTIMGRMSSTHILQFDRFLAILAIK